VTRVDVVEAGELVVEQVARVQYDVDRVVVVVGVFPPRDGQRLLERVEEVLPSGVVAILVTPDVGVADVEDRGRHAVVHPPRRGPEVVRSISIPIDAPGIHKTTCLDHTNVPKRWGSGLM